MGKISLEDLTKLVKGLVDQGGWVLGYSRQHGGLDVESYSEWLGSCRLLMRHLGDTSEPWTGSFDQAKDDDMLEAEMAFGAIKSIQRAIKSGFLVRFENLVLAQIFSGMYEQAEYLFQQNFTLASAVILRAILEERLRKLCVNHDCVPEVTSSKRPSIGHYNESLKKQGVYDLITWRKVSSMADVGNAAAHNEKYEESDVEGFLRDLKPFLEKFAA